MPLPLALLAATMIPGLIPGLGKSIAGIGDGIGSAAKGYGQGVGSAFSGLGKGAGSIASGVGGGIGAAAGGLGKGVGGLAEKGLGAVGDFLFGDDEEDTNYDTMTIDTLEIDTLEIDTANIDKLVIDSKDLGKTDDNKTDFEKIDTNQKEDTTENLFSIISEDIEKPAAAQFSPDQTNQKEDTTENLFSIISEDIEKPAAAENQKGTNNNEDSLTPNINAMTKSSGEMANILMGGKSIGNSFGDLTMDAHRMLHELGDINETLATPDEGPGFNWEDIKVQSWATGGDGILTGIVEALMTPITKGVSLLWEGAKGLWEGAKSGAGALWEGAKGGAGALWEGAKGGAGALWEGAGALWEGAKGGAGALWEGALDLLGFDTESDVESKLTEGGIGDEVIGILESIRDCTCGIFNILNNGRFQEDQTFGFQEDGFQEDQTFGFQEDQTIHPIVVEDQDVDIALLSEDMKEITNDVTEFKNPLQQKPNQPPISLSKGRIHNTNQPQTRGMTPAYTKAPPSIPPPNSTTIVQEIRSYNQYPPWMWKMG